MKIHVWTVRIMSISAALSFMGIFLLQKCGDCFWRDILIGVFSSSLVSLTISFVAFLQEREKVLKKFYENLGQCYFSTLVFKGEISILKASADANKLYRLGEKINKAMHNAKEADDRKNELMDYHYCDFSFYKFISKTYKFVHTTHCDLHIIKLQLAAQKFNFNANKPIIMQRKNSLSELNGQPLLYTEEQIQEAFSSAKTDIELLLTLSDLQIGIIDAKMASLEKIYKPDWSWSKQKEFWHSKAEEHIAASTQLNEVLE